MNEYVTVIFDAAGGGITVSSKRVKVGEPYGELPPPARFGYEFDGWYTAEEGGELITPETIVADENVHPLYAHWTKNVRSDEKLRAYRKKKATLKRQKVIVAVAIVLVIAAIAGLCGVAYIVNRTNLTDVDGTVYKIIKRGSVYVLCDSVTETELDMTEDGKYYVTDAGSQIKLNSTTGEASIYAYVPVEGQEVVGNIVTARILAFPQVEKKRMKRLEVHNDYGSYAFIGVHNSDGDSYYIEGLKNTSYSQEQFASLIVSCGYVLAMEKVENPVRDENGEFSDYGLVSETRIDADGNEYTYTPAWYELTDVDGNCYRVIVGDAIVSGAGYYVQYQNPDYPDKAYIYIVNSDIQQTVLQPVEALVEPLIVYPMSLNNYFNVKDFTITSDDSDIVISFSYIPLEERMGTMLQSSPYVFGTKGMETLRAHSTNLDTTLQSLSSLSYVGVVKVCPDDRDVVIYGINAPSHVVYYKYLVTDSDTGDTTEIEHMLVFSQLTESGTYYVYSSLTDMIVEIERRYLPFLDYEFSDWIDESAYSFNLGCTDEIILQKGSDIVEFETDNSNSDQYALTMFTSTAYTATSYWGKKVTYYLVKENGKYLVREGSTDGEAVKTFKSDEDYFLSSEGKLYLIQSQSNFTKATAGGKTGKCTLYVGGYDKTSDSVLYFFVDESTGSWGRVKRTLGSADITVDATVNSAKQGQVTTQYFRHFFQTILYASIEGECKLTEAEREAFRALPDSEAELVMTVKTEDGDFVFRFYRYTERKSYITINGEGSYYILTDRVEKIWNDAQKVLAGEDVTATSKN